MGTDWRGRPTVSTPAAQWLSWPKRTFTCPQGCFLRAPSPPLRCVLAHVGMRTQGRGEGRTQSRWESGPDYRACSEEEHQQWGTGIPRSASGSGPSGSYKDWGRDGGTRQRETGTRPKALGQLGAAAGGGMGTKAQLSTHKPVGHLRVSL